MSLGKRIRELREAKGLTQTAVASATGVSPGAVSRWETGLTKSITGETLLKLATVLGITPNLLFEIGEGKTETIAKPLCTEEEKILTLYRALSKMHKEIAVRLLKAL